MDRFDEARPSGGNQPPPPSIPDIDGLTVIGYGGFSIVYRGRQRDLGRDVAVKVISSRENPELTRERWRREVTAMARLSNHPNIVAVFAGGLTDDGSPYLVMPYVPGGSLGERIKAHGPLGPADVATLGMKLAGALAGAHQAGILHRDVKPDNVLLSPYGEPQLTDFGIARLLDRTTTLTGQLHATIPYAAPEVLSGQAATEASDVYSLGATLWAALTGQPPFPSVSEDDSLVSVIGRIVTQPVPDLRLRGVPDALAAVLESTLAKTPDARPATGAELQRRLAGVAEALGADHAAGFAPGATMSLTPPPAGGTATVGGAPGPDEATAVPAADAGPPDATVVDGVAPVPPGPARFVGISRSDEPVPPHGRGWDDTGVEVDADAGSDGDADSPRARPPAVDPGAPAPWRPRDDYLRRVPVALTGVAAAADPASGAPTQATGAVDRDTNGSAGATTSFASAPPPPLASPPPGRPVAAADPPDGSDGDGPVDPSDRGNRRDRSPAVLVAAAAVALLVLAAAAAGISRAHDNDDTAAPVPIAAEPTTTARSDAGVAITTVPAPTTAPSTAAVTTTTRRPPTTETPTTTPPTTAAPAPSPAAAGSPSGTAAAYFGALSRGDLGGAYALLTPEFRQLQSRASYDSFWGQYAVQIAGPVRESGNRVTVPVSLNGRTQEYTLTLTPRDGGWLVDGPRPA